MTVAEMSEKLSLNVISLVDECREVSGVYIGDLLSWVMGRAQSDNVWITIMSNVNVIAVASLADVACVLLAEGVTLPDDVKVIAEQKGINVFSSQCTAYELSIRISELLK